MLLGEDLARPLVQEEVEGHLRRGDGRGAGPGANDVDVLGGLRRLPEPGLCLGGEEIGLSEPEVRMVAVPASLAHAVGWGGWEAGHRGGVQTESPRTSRVARMTSASSEGLE